MHYFALVLILLWLPQASFSKEAAPPADHHLELQKFSQALYYLQKYYVNPEKVKTENLINEALSGIAASLDPHTVFLPKDIYQRTKEDTEGKYAGIGVTLSQTNARLFVVYVAPASPAERAGILQGDEIVAVDGKRLDKVRESVAMELLNGEVGTSVTLKILRTSKQLEFSLRRALIEVASAETFLLAEGLHFIKLSSFQEDSYDQLSRMLAKTGNKISGLVLDLRDNPGGLFDQAVKVADLFLESGLIVSTLGRDLSQVEREFATKKESYIHFPMIVLVNQGSASASEILAGALQDHKRALIMGTKTFGKGSVQTIIPLPDGSGFKITIAIYYTPADRSIQAKGIEPDIYVSQKKPDLDKGAAQREADLKGHLMATDLSDFAKTTQKSNEINLWPETYRDDFQLITAFTYLKGFRIFQAATPLAKK